METLDLERIRDGFPGITPTFGGVLLEACLVCLEKQGHTPGTVLHVYGGWNIDVELQWSTVVDEQMRRSWNNQDEMTEYAAICLVALLVNQLTLYMVLERADKTTGIDYWLMSKSTPEIDEPSGRLGVSGIFSGTTAQITRRFQMKLIQSDQSDATNLPAIIGIAEFSKPQTRLEEKK
jgi:drug/metabolite transporter superfamily protein YnfA